MSKFVAINSLIILFNNSDTLSLSINVYVFFGSGTNPLALPFTSPLLPLLTPASARSGENIFTFSSNKNKMGITMIFWCYHLHWRLPMKFIHFEWNGIIVDRIVYASWISDNFVKDFTSSFNSFRPRVYLNVKRLYTNS